MEVKTKNSKIAKFIRELAKETHPADIATFALWIVGFCLWIHCDSIAKNTNLSLEIRAISSIKMAILSLMIKSHIL